MHLDVLARCLHIGEAVLGLDHLEVHQLAGRIFDEHQQRGLRATLLEPPTVAGTVDLDQLAAAVAAIARLVGGRP